MKRLAGILLATLLATSAHAASTINSLPPVQPFPLNDAGNPASSVQNLWITNGSGPGTDFRITPQQLGLFFQGPVAPTSPFRYQYWWDTSVSPPQLRVYDGAQWIAAGALDSTAHTFQFNNSNLAPGNYPNITGIGGLTIAGGFPLTLTTTAITNSTLPAGTHSLAPLDSPAFTTPSLGVATGTSLALGGATIGSNSLAVTGTSALGGKLTVTNGVVVNGAANYLADGLGLVASTAAIRMPAAKADNSCFNAISSIIDYGAANGNPAGGSYSFWDCTFQGGNFGWVDGGVGIGQVSTHGFQSFPANGQNGYTAAPTSGTGAAAFANTGAWVDGLNISGSTVSDAGIVLQANATGSIVKYDSSNFTDLTGSAGTGVYRIHAGGSLNALFGAGSLTLGSTTPIHLLFSQSSAPVLSSCGTSPNIVGSDAAGTVTMGTGSPTGCVITFSTAYASAPHCNVTWEGNPLAAQSYAVSTSAITLTQTGTSSNVVDYVCAG